LIRRFPNGGTHLGENQDSLELKSSTANLVKWNISVTRGKENNSYCLSSGERKGRSLNLIYLFYTYIEGCRANASSNLFEAESNKFCWLIELSWKGQPQRVIVP